MLLTAAVAYVFRARNDRHERTGASRRSSTPCFGCVKSVPQDAGFKEIDTMIALIMTDSSSGYVHTAPLRPKIMGTHGAKVAGLCRPVGTLRSQLP